MNRRYTGAEALKLVAKATKRPWTAGELNADDEVPVFVTDRSIVRAVVIAVNDSPEENAALCAAAPDLAESLAAVEAERDALRAELAAVEAARVELREAEREHAELTADYERIWKKDPARDAVGDEMRAAQRRVEAALAALRGAAK